MNYFQLCKIFNLLLAVFVNVLKLLAAQNGANSTPRLGLEENCPLGTKVTSLENLGFDLNNKDQIMLTSTVKLFKIEEENGQFFIVTSQEIDREDSRTCKLNRQNNFTCLIELDIIDVSTLESRRVEIVIYDLNDHHPTFSDKVHDISIPETIQPEQSPFSIPYATDPDSRQNSIQEYSLIPISPLIYDVFSLKFSERTDGVIIPKLLVNRELDFERESHYLLKIIAKDPSYEGSMLINVSVVDINDNSPIFIQSEQRVEVSENDPVGKVVLKVSATDSDSGENGKVTYRFAEETLPEILEYFTIGRETGEIMLSKSLKSQGGQTLSVQVEARDGARAPLTDLMTTEFVIRDVNDNKPVITFNPLQKWQVGNRTIYFSENEKRKVIGFFRVSDNDPGVFGKTVLHQLNATDYFELKRIRDGMHSFSTKLSFDREDKDSYAVQFRAVDCAQDFPPSTCIPLETLQTFIFYVGDVNDCRPRFERFRYNYTIVEETEPTILDTIRVEDEDYGLNSTVRFTIHSQQHEKWFHIDPVTGVFKTLQKLDRELIGSSVNVTIRAYDLGKPAKFEYKVFEISIIDIDDNAPKFNQSSYTFKVLEGQGVGKEVGRVEAVDPDVNSCVTYQSSTSEPYSEIFEVDPYTGIISTKKDFDFETEIQKEFYFEVYASSCESPQKMDFVRANIQLIDDNDNSPKIVKPMDGEEFSIPWDAEPSFVVTEIVAIDADSGRNQKLTYHISDAKKLFGVDSIKGVIFVRDRDIFKFKDKRFPIEVRVSDNGLSTNHVVQQNFIYFDGNVTLYNHTAPGPPDLFDIDAQMPRIMIYAVSTIGVIVLIIIIIWIVLLFRLRNSRSQNNTIKAHYSVVAGETQINHQTAAAHHANYPIINGTLARSQSPGSAGIGSHQGALKHAEGSDNLSSGSTPSPDDRGGSNMINMSQSQLSTFSERLGATPQPRYPGSEYRGAATLDKRHTNAVQQSPMIYYPQRSCHPGGTMPPPQHFATNSDGFQGYPPSYPISDNILAIPQHIRFNSHQLPGNYPYESATISGTKTNALDKSGSGSPTADLSTFHPSRSMSDGANALNMVYPNSVSTPTKSKPPSHMGGGPTDINSPTPTPNTANLYANSPKPITPQMSAKGLPPVEYPSNSRTSQRKPSLVSGPTNHSETDDSSPEVPPRPSDPDHPRNSGTIIRPANQVLYPPMNGHEKWNLPSENSFRNSSHPKSPVATKNSELEVPGPQELQISSEAPDLCQDVKDSLERNQRSLRGQKKVTVATDDPNNRTANV